MLQNRVICVVGPKGTGKSFRVCQMYAKSKRALVFNAAFDKEYRVRSTHLVHEDVIGAGRVMQKEQTYRICFETENVIRKGQNMIYPDLDPIVLACMNNPPMMLIVEEAHMTCSYITATDEILRSVFIGRHHQLDEVYCMHRMSGEGGVHPVIRANADEYHIFRLSEPGDLKFVAQKCGADAAYTVANLRRLQEKDGKVIPGQCFVWTTEGEMRVEG